MLKSLKTISERTYKVDCCVASIIILFFPDAKLLVRLLDSVRSQVGAVYVIDNTPSHTLEWLVEDWFVTERL
jgi:hypothetical protein